MALVAKMLSQQARQYCVVARNISSWRGITQQRKEENLQHEQNLEAAQKRGETLREDIYLLSNGSNKSLYELVDHGKIVTKRPTIGENYLRLDKEMITDRLYIKKQELFVMYMLGVAKYVENYEGLRKDEDRQIEQKKTLDLQTQAVSSIDLVSNLSDALKIIEPVLQKFDPGMKIKVLSRLQEIVYYQFGQRILDGTEKLFDARRTSLAAKGILSNLHDDPDLVAFIKSIDPGVITQSELLRYLHALSMIHFMDETDVQSLLEKKCLDTSFKPSLAEIKMFSDLIAWSRAKGDVLKEVIGEDFLFGKFKEIICDEEIKTKQLGQVLKLCARFTKQIGKCDKTSSFRKVLLEKLESVMNSENPLVALNLLLWQNTLENVRDTENVEFDDELRFSEKWLEPASKILIKELTPSDFYYLPRISKYFGPIELKELKETAVEHIDSGMLTLHEVMHCGQVCNSDSISAGTLDTILEMISECDNETFAQILCRLSDDIWRTVEFQRQVLRRLVSVAPYLMENELGLCGFYNYMLIVCEQKNTNKVWKQTQVQEIFSVYKEVIRDVPIKSSMHPSKKCLLFKLLLLIDKFSNVDVKSKMKVKELAHNITAEGVMDIEAELFLQLYKMFSRAGEVTDRSFISWVIKTCVGLLVNKSEGKDPALVGTDPDYLRLLLGRDRLAVSLFVDYFYNKLWLDRSEIDDDNVMNSSVQKLLAVLDHLQLEIDSELLSKLLNAIPYTSLNSEDLKTYKKILENQVMKSFKHLEVDMERPDMEGFAEEYCKALQLLSRSVHAGCRTDDLMKSVLSEDHMMMVFHIVAGNCHGNMDIKLGQTLVCKRLKIRQKIKL